MHIRPLPDDPNVIHTLSRWHVAEWAHLFDGWDAAVCARELRECVDNAGGASLPKTWVVEDDDGLQGSVSLIEHDADALRDIEGPWLASLYVREASRGRGIGRALVRKVMQHARETGLEQLHLFTPHHADFYSALGWRHTQTRVVNGESVQVMRFNASDAEAADV